MSSVAVMEKEETMEMESTAPVVIIAERVETRWDYDKSVKKVKGLVMRWKKTSLEALDELYQARLQLSNRGVHPVSDELNWGKYLIAVGLAKSTVHDWLKGYDAEKKCLIDPVKKTAKPKKALLPDSKSVETVEKVGDEPEPDKKVGDEPEPDKKVGEKVDKKVNKMVVLDESPEVKYLDALQDTMKTLPVNIPESMSDKGKKLAKEWAKTITARLLPLLTSTPELDEVKAKRKKVS